MCIGIKEEKDYWDATNSWSGYNYQGKVALFVVLKKINELICMGKADEIKKYVVELEWLEDFSILYKNGNDTQYETIHQVKAKNKHNIADYEDALVKMYYKGVKRSTIKIAYLHICNPINYNDTEWNDNVKKLIVKCSQTEKMKDSIIKYKNSEFKKEEVEKIYKPKEKSSINKLINEYNEKYFNFRKVDVDNVDKILDKILSDLNEQIATCKKEIKDENINKIKVYSYPDKKTYCELGEIDNLIKKEIINYWENVGAEGWKCVDQSFCDTIFLCLKGLIDNHITQRHIQYNKTKERSIEFICIKKILDSDDSIKRSEEYYLYRIKEKLLLLCDEYHRYCIDECDTEEREAYCKKCEVNSFYEKISKMSQYKIRDLIHAINPNILKKIDEMNWSDYCNEDRYKNPFFKGLRDIEAPYEKNKNYISYLGKDKKMNLLTTMGNNDGSKKALMRACSAIVSNLDLYEIEILMDYDYLISKDLETENSIYDEAGDFLKHFKLEEDHIYHCKNIKIVSLQSAIANIDGGIEK